MPAKIAVIGSINMDLVSTTDRFPNKGETILGTDFKNIPGGKGANQAVAAAKLGADVTMIGCVGDDPFGPPLIENLKANGVNTDNVEPVTGVPTGIAAITVADQDNTIIVIPGANHHVTPEVVQSHEEVIKESDLILLQFEIPMESVKQAVELAAKHGTKVVLNPAPAQSVELDLLEKVDFLTPNEHELEILLDTDEKKEFYQLNREKFFITQGEKGVLYYDGEKEVLVPSYKVDVVDTTGAGDTFNGGFSVAIAEGKSLKEACYDGNIVGAISVSKFGAQTGMPTKDEVANFLAKRG
ncbi:ribokinase [Piscibacillus halophilus]|uniref:Ribokinase n=1 Tax=Piscibacillus halophilus TaxID=571933 RepID=A0A1H9I5Q6_9BACI|nr:ribokinase [Piscibacillus halophilus]SEQ69893.1 ribokinase [Piscibacillus halophilus]